MESGRLSAIVENCFSFSARSSIASNSSSGICVHILSSSLYELDEDDAARRISFRSFAVAVSSLSLSRAMCLRIWLQINSLWLLFMARNLKIYSHRSINTLDFFLVCLFGEGLSRVADLRNMCVP